MLATILRRNHIRYPLKVSLPSFVSALSEENYLSSVPAFFSDPSRQPRLSFAQLTCTKISLGAKFLTTFTPQQAPLSHKAWPQKATVLLRRGEGRATIHAVSLHNRAATESRKLTQGRCSLRFLSRFRPRSNCMAVPLS